MSQTKGSASFLGKAGPLVLARFATAILTICIPLVLARRFSLADYGTYKQLFLIFNTLYFVLPFGMIQGLYFFIPRADERRAYFMHTLLWVLGTGALAALAIVSGGDAIARAFHNPELAHYKHELALYTWFLVGGASLEISLTSQGKTRASAACYLISDTLRAATMTLPVLLGFGLIGTMNTMVGFAALRLIVNWAVVLPGAKGPLFSWKVFRQQLAYGVPFGAAMLLAIPQQQLHQWMVSSLVTPEMFALYAVGCFQLPIVDLLYTPTSEVLMVRLGELDKLGQLEEGLYAFREACAKLALVFLPSAAFLFAAAPEFIGGLFGARYLSAVPLFRVSVLGIALAIFPVDGVLRARDETRHIFISYFVKAVVTLPLVWFLVHRLGMIGGIGSWAIAELVGKSMLVLRVPRALSTERRKVRLAELFPWRELGRAAGAAAVAAVGVTAARFATEGVIARRSRSRRCCSRWATSRGWSRSGSGRAR
jgi:O-antigen/teichoic acid export membrane protein